MLRNIPQKAEEGCEYGELPGVVLVRHLVSLKVINDVVN
jgi:hypothetical protein